MSLGFVSRRGWTGRLHHRKPHTIKTALRKKQAHSELKTPQNGALQTFVTIGTKFCKFVPMNYERIKPNEGELMQAVNPYQIILNLPFGPTYLPSRHNVPTMMHISCLFI